MDPPAYGSLRRSERCPGVAGDIVAVRCSTCVHYMLNVGNNYVVHRNIDYDGRGESHDTKKRDDRGRVIKELFSDSAWAGMECWVDNMMDGEWAPLPTEKIVALATIYEGQEGYSILSKNCEHFVTMCRYGRATSPQVKEAFSTVAKDIGTDAMAAGGEAGKTVGVIGGAIGGFTGLAVGYAFGYVADRCAEDEVARGKRTWSGHCRRNEWAETCGKIGAVGVGCVGAAAGALLGGLFGAVTGSAKGVAHVAHDHNTDVGSMLGICSSSPRKDLTG